MNIRMLVNNKAVMEKVLEISLKKANEKKIEKQGWPTFEKPPSRNETSNLTRAQSYKFFNKSLPPINLGRNMS